jgi:hypothetical protein
MKRTEKAMFNSSRFYDLAKEIRKTLKCRQETAEYLAALQQWIEEGIPSDASELKREASVLHVLSDRCGRKVPLRVAE